MVDRVTMAQSSDPQHRELTPIEKLPHELVLEIGSYLELPSDHVSLSHSCKALWLVFGERELIKKDAEFHRRWVGMRRATGLDFRFNKLFEGLEDKFSGMPTDSITELVRERRHGLRYDPDRLQPLRVRPALLRAIETKQDLRILTTIVDTYREVFPEALHRGLGPMFPPPVAVAIDCGNLDALKLLVERDVPVDVCPGGEYSYREALDWHVASLDRYAEESDDHKFRACSCACDHGEEVFARAFGMEQFDIAAFVVFELGMTRPSLDVVTHQPVPELVRGILARGASGEGGLLVDRRQSLELALRNAFWSWEDGNLEVIGLLVEAITSSSSDGDKKGGDMDAEELAGYLAGHVTGCGSRELRPQNWEHLSKLVPGLAAKEEENEAQYLSYQ
ncbi:hypothetical protein F5X96DRAFT_670996 [Biscogniauxia mediterranea]|nr:hypothetical protein F5X96DRAFT_670996 [Biscogniauxia mediterranea]